MFAEWKQNVKYLLFVGALGLGAISANAQQYLNAKFTLPHEARWASNTLQPGEYHIRMSQGILASFLYLEREGKSVAILAGPVEREPVTDKGHIKLVDVDGTYVVREFDAGWVGKSFTFALPKHVKNTELGSTRRPETTITVESGQ